MVLSFVLFQVNVVLGLRNFAEMVVKGLLSASISAGAPESPVAQLPSSIVDQALTQIYNKASTSYDKLDGGDLVEKLGLNSLRRKLGLDTSGKVLEVGVGTGLQLPYYDWPYVSSFTGLDISPGMLQLAQEKAVALAGKTPVSFVVGNAQQLPSEDNSVRDSRLVFYVISFSTYPHLSLQFDIVADTFSMCVYSNPSAVLSEMKRVVKSDTGRILLLENSISTNPVLALMQKALSPLITPMSRGCKWDVDVPQLVEQVGLQQVHYEDVQQGTFMYGVYKKPS